MSIVAFKSEFSALLKRYTNVTSPTNESLKISSSPARNHQELLDAIRDSLSSVINVKLQFLEESSLKTPANNEIIVATPHAPDVLRMDYNQSDRFEAFKSFVESENGFKVLPNYNGLHTHHEEKVEVLDNETSVDNANNNNKDTKNANLLMKEPGGFHQKLILTHIVEEAQQNVQKLASNLHRMADILIPESRPEAHAVRRLSTILNPSTKKPTLNQSLRSTTIQRAKAARRSFVAAATDDVVTTPTTSRPSHVMPTTVIKKPVASVSKLAQHSVSFSGDKPKSPVKSFKNPKYAHVQSTIPKHIVAKKKT